MGKDTTAFRERFNAYKNGKPVSEIYDAGLPRYNRGKKSVVDSLDEEQLDTLHHIHDYFSNLGMSRQDIAGIAANMFKESSFRHNAKDSSGYHGYVLMSPDMQTAVKAVYGNLDPDTLLLFVYDQITGNSKVKGYTNGRGYKYGQYKTGGDAAEAFRSTFERNKAGRQQSRIDYGDLFYDYFNQRALQLTIGELPKPIILQPVSTAVCTTIPQELTKARWDGVEQVSPYITGKPMVKLRPRLQLPNLVELMEDSEWEPGFPGLKNGKLPGYKIGHNVSNAKLNEDGTFTDDYTKVFEDMYVTPQKTDLKRGSYTLNNFPYYLQHRTDWMKPFMSSATNEKGLELTYPEFDLLLGGRQLATTVFPLKKPSYRQFEEIDFDNIAKQAAKMKADDDAWRVAHPEYEIENILKKLKLPNAYDPAIEDLVKNANLEDRSLRSVFDKMLYENKDFHGKQIVNLHNNRAKLSGDFVDDVGQVFDVDTPEGYENAILFLEKHFFGTRDGAERLLKDPDFQSRLAGFSMPRGNKPVFISRNKLILRLERDLGRKLTLQEADDLYYKVISHERHHSFDKIHNTPEGFNLDGLSPDDYFVKNGFDELAARGTLLKNMFGLYKNPLTAAHLRYASSQYFKDPSNINNNMTRFFNMITDYDKAAKWLQENATAVLPYTVGGSIVASLPEYKNGKSPIHIKPINRGKFNATKKRTGKTTEELAHSKNPLTRKRAIFALNARKWKH